MLAEIHIYIGAHSYRVFEWINIGLYGTYSERKGYKMNFVWCMV